MTTSKTFELIVLASLIHRKTFLDVDEEQMTEVIIHVVGEDAYERNPEQAYIDTVGHIYATCPKVDAAAELLKYSAPDVPRYNKLIDLYRKYHEVTSLVEETAVA